MLFHRYYPKNEPKIPKCPITDKNTDHWANDKVIAIWMCQLREIDAAMCKEDRLRPKTLFIDPIVDLHELIAAQKWFKINKLYKKMRSQAGLSLVDYDRIVIPVNEHLHWTFQTIYLNKRTIVFSDSLHRSASKRKNAPESLLDFVEYFSKLDNRRFDRKFWKIVQAKTMEQVHYIYLFIMKYLRFSKRMWMVCLMYLFSGGWV